MFIANTRLNSLAEKIVLCWSNVLVGYNENVKPNIANSFATAAMRFGHTQLQGMFHGRDAGFNAISDIALSTVQS